MFHRILTLLALCLATTAHAADEAKAFRAGAFAQDITPTRFPISVNGGMADRLAKGFHDRLHARCLVLDDGTTQLALVVCDSCMIPREIFDEAKELASKATGIPTSRMLMSATHTHTAVANAADLNPAGRACKRLTAFLPVASAVIALLDNHRTIGAHDEALCRPSAAVEAASTRS